MVRQNADVRSVVANSDSHLSFFCAGLVESVWLAAGCVVSILLIPQCAHAGYQPVKFGFARVLALIGAAAWLTRAIERRTFVADLRAALSALLRAPFAISLGLFLVMVAISTVFSVNPWVSFGGAVETFGGALTIAALVVLFALVAGNLRAREQVDRLVTILLVTGFAVSIFAIVQRFGWDPRFPKLKGERVIATAGHPIYLAGYLLMLIPLTNYRLLELWRARNRSGKSIRRIAIGFYLLVLITQVTAFFCAESRGPTIALAVAATAFAVMLVAFQKHQRSLVVIGVCMLSTLVAITIAVGVSGLKNVPGFGRFAEVRPVQQGVEVFRAEIWKQALPIVLTRRAVTHPTDGRVDRWRALRLWIGYGPETLDSVLPFYYQVDVANFALENRFHDLVWDLWFSIGLIGLIAFVGLVLFLFGAAYQALGFIKSRTNAACFFVCNIVCMVLGILVLTLLMGVGFAGLGLLGGLVVGLLLFAIGSRFGTKANSRGNHVDHVLMIAILAAIAGHLIDAGFAFVTASTSVLFWIYAGLLVAILRGIKDQQSVPSPARESITSAVLVSMGLVSLIISTIHHFSFDRFSIGDLIIRSLCDIEGTEGRYSLLILPLVAFWIAGSLAFVLHVVEGRSHRNSAAFLIRVVSISVGFGIVFLLLQTVQIVHIGPIPRPWAGESASLNAALGYERLLEIEMAILVLLMFAFAWSRQTTATNLLGSRRGMIAAALCVPTGLLGTSIIAIQSLRALICCDWGVALGQNNRRELSIPAYRQAIELDPRPFLFRALFSHACLEAANDEEDPDRRENYLREVEKALLDAQKMNDLNRASFFLAYNYLAWAAGKPEPMKATLNRKALTAAREARIFEPHTPPVASLNELAEKLSGNANSNP